MHVRLIDWLIDGIPFSRKFHMRKANKTLSVKVVYRANGGDGFFTDDAWVDAQQNHTAVGHDAAANDDVVELWTGHLDIPDKRNISTALYLIYLTISERYHLTFPITNLWFRYFVLTDRKKTAKKMPAMDRAAIVMKLTRERCSNRTTSMVRSRGAFFWPKEHRQNNAKLWK